MTPARAAAETILIPCYEGFSPVTGTLTNSHSLDAPLKIPIYLFIYFKYITSNSGCCSKLVSNPTPPVAFSKMKSQEYHFSKNINLFPSSQEWFSNIIPYYIQFLNYIQVLSVFCKILKTKPLGI